MVNQAAFDQEDGRIAKVTSEVKKGVTRSSVELIGARREVIIGLDITSNENASKTTIALQVIMFNLSVVAVIKIWSKGRRL